MSAVLDGIAIGAGFSTFACLLYASVERERAYWRGRRDALLTQHYDHDRLAQAIEARRATTTGGVEDESATPKGCAQTGEQA